MIIIILFLAHWYASLFCQSFFLHRYMAHKMFLMNKFWERTFYFLCYCCQGASYLNPRAYAILHRMHHAYSDKEKDPHSPHHASNLFMMMWHTKKLYKKCHEKSFSEAIKFGNNIPRWALLDKFGCTYWSRISWGIMYTIIYFLCISVWQLPYTHWTMYALLPIHYLMGPIHGAIVNWCGHKYGYANFDNNDKSKNSLIIDFLMLGELFQNNHHKLPNRVNFAVKWFELDPTYPIVRLLHAIRIIRLNVTKKSLC